MPILSTIGRKRWSQRLVVLGLYLVLGGFGATMVVPFLITLTGSISNDLDYQRFQPVPRFLYSREDRFAKGLVGYFNTYAGWRQQLKAHFPDAPDSWTGWLAIGRDEPGIDAFARAHLAPPSGDWTHWERMAADYAAFALEHPITDTLAPVHKHAANLYLGEKFGAEWAALHPAAAASAGRAERRAGALDALAADWGVRLEDFSNVSLNEELNAPLWQPRWLPPTHAKARTFQGMKGAYRRHEYSPGVEARWRDYFSARAAADDGSAPWPVTADAPPATLALWREFVAAEAPAPPALPFALRVAWFDHLASDEVRVAAGLGEAGSFTVADYNRLAGAAYDNLWRTPFPIPASFPEEIQAIWRDFIGKRWPLRLQTFAPGPDTQAAFVAELQKRLLTIENANLLFNTRHTAWSQFTFTPSPPDDAQAALRPLWLDFAATLPAAERRLDSSEIRFQRAMLARHGSLAALNTAWGTGYRHIEEVFPPFAQAYAVQFRHFEWPLTLAPMARNYMMISDFLFFRSHAVGVTVVLVVLSILVSLTVNPITAYALSRFNLRGQDKIILFLIATSAFPGMISAIPSFLLMRDLGMLNTFLALLLPGAANGMAIFILKGFFDSLPAELYEAATIDGAKEWQIFFHVSLPLIKPILAVNALGAFMAAYSGWEWALIIAQDSSMWTVSVWMIQANQWFAESPWITSAGFIIVSIPVLVVFLCCQKIILKGIILPQMK